MSDKPFVSKNKTDDYATWHFFWHIQQKHIKYLPKPLSLYMKKSGF